MKYFSFSPNRKILLFFTVTFAVLSSLVFVFIYLNINEPLPLPTSNSQTVTFPLVELPDGGFDLPCVINSIEESSFSLASNIEVQYYVICSIANGSSRQELLIPLVLYNSQNSLTAFLGIGIFKGEKYQKLALKNAFSELSPGKTIIVSFDSDKEHYKNTSEVSLFNLVGTWVEENQSSINLFIQSGNVKDLKKLNRHNILVPFFITTT